MRDKDIILSDDHKRKISISKMGAKNPKARQVLDTETGQVFNTITEAAKVLGIKQNCLNKKLLGYRKNNTGFVFMTSSNAEEQ